MDVYAIAGIFAGIVQAYSIVPYVRDMLYGETRPNIVSWALWTLIQIIIIAAQFSAGASWAIVIPIVMTFNTCLVLVLCFLGHGYTKYGFVDAACLILAMAAIIAWRLTNDPTLAILLSIVADVIAGVPTYIKTYKEPFSESFTAWALLILANGLALVAAHPFNIANAAFSLYIFVGDLLFISVIFVRRDTVRKERNT